MEKFDCPLSKLLRDKKNKNKKKEDHSEVSKEENVTLGRSLMSQDTQLVPTDILEADRVAAQAQVLAKSGELNKLTARIKSDKSEMLNKF